MNPPSILVLDASAPLGVHLLSTSTKFHPRPHVHAFYPQHSHLSDEQAQLCHSLHEGVLPNSTDLKKALEATRPSVVILTIDSSVQRLRLKPLSGKQKKGVAVEDSLRLAVAQALMDAIDLLHSPNVPPSKSSSSAPAPTETTEQTAAPREGLTPTENTSPEKIQKSQNKSRVGPRPKIIVISAFGAEGTTPFRVGLGFGRMVNVIRRAELQDFGKQEREIKARMGVEAKNRLLIVRPACLTNGEARGKINQFQGGRALSGRISRRDVAAWVMHKALGGTESFGKEICLCTDKAHKRRWTVHLKPKEMKL